MHVYGQMVSSQLRYGIIHLYEVWWFCYRDGQGNFGISPPVLSNETAPFSVLQIIKAMLGFDDLALEQVTVHPGSASKVAAAENPKRKSHDQLSKTKGAKKKGVSGTSRQSPKRGGTKSRSLTSASSPADPDGFASQVFMWDCNIVDFTSNVKILSKKNDMSVLIKIPLRSDAVHIASEIENEAAMYQGLAGNSEVRDVIPKYFGFSTHLGVPMLCVGREGMDFDDIGLENLSEALKASALDCLRRLAHAGVVHHDLALRNIVQSADNPEHAKIIDFGRAEFTQDERLLQEQVSRLEFILQHGED
ncbi:MAG: hypothetical protein SGILL_010298 [Bacillariaceae sp.]